MRRENVSDLLTFLGCRAGAKLHQGGEKARDLPIGAKPHDPRTRREAWPRLLARTTRSVSPTEAGKRVLASVGSRFEEIEAEVEALSELRDKPAGTVRITATENATSTILLPKLAKFLPQYPRSKSSSTTA